MQIRITRKKQHVDYYEQTFYIILIVWGFLLSFANDTFIPCWIMSVGVVNLSKKYLNREYYFFFALLILFGSLHECKYQLDAYNLLAFWSFLYIKLTIYVIIILMINITLVTLFQYYLLSHYYKIQMKY
jgi:hypothetical protein